jgi:alkylation response protein AidB-like acyl-CoA dehydrogenase
MVDKPSQDEALLARMVKRARDIGEDIPGALAIARDCGAVLPLPGSGRTSQRWAVLTELGRVNLTAARVLEAHCDALAILAESGRDVTVDRRTWGVFAAEAPGFKLDAEQTAHGVVLTGTKPWCSLGANLDAALVTARVGGGRGLFEVDLQRPDVRADPPQGWVARGLRTVISGPVTFDRTPATAVGNADWYVRRPGFAWGGIGVAACWHGAALGLADSLLESVRTRPRELDDFYVGAVDAAVHASACALAAAAGAVDGGAVADPNLLAARTRAVVASSAELVLSYVGHALGPAPMAFDAEHAARVADLSLYVRQHHAERDLVDLGRRLIGPDA